MGTNEAWLAKLDEEIVEPDLKICDPHHHLWGYRKDAIMPRYLLEELLEDIGSGHNVVSTVFVEAKAMYRADGPEEMKAVGEIEFVNGVAAMSASGIYGDARVCGGIIGATNLDVGAAAGKVLDAMIAAAPNRFRGIRNSATWDPDPVVRGHRSAPQHRMMNPKHREGAAELGKRGLLYEAWCFHPQLPELVDLARALPDVDFVLDHIGGPIGIGAAYEGKRAEIMENWRMNMAELATCPNVSIKLGGIFMEVNGFAWHTRPKPPSSDELAEAARPYFEFVIEKFGPDRAMFESNFPVEKISTGYKILWNAFKKLARNYSPSEKAKLFHDTAARVYRIGA
jgi:predicted TIM-barrel fold metal-dependent hydrolase